MIRYSQENTKGFTLIEMIIALSIFTIILLIATNIYVIVNLSQRKIAAQQKIQDDVRYMIETIAQDVRLGQISYAFYNTPDLDLHPDAGKTINILALLDQTGLPMYYRWTASSQSVQYCKPTSTTDLSCDQINGSGWQDVTPQGVKIINLSFIITPSADPFTALSTAPPTCIAVGKGTNCSTMWGYSCQTINQTCVYYSDGHNYQPRVRIMVRSQATDTKLTAQSQTLDLETIVSSRIMPGQVKNTFHD